MAPKIKEQVFVKEYNDFQGNTLSFHKHLDKKYGIGSNHNTTYCRLKTLRKNGKIALPSGNKVSTGEILKGTSTLHMRGRN